MRLLATVCMIVMAGVSQVTVAPLFPVRGAVIEFGLFAVVLLALTAGPRMAMLAVPFVALAVGFASDRSPALLILAYLPLLPLAALVEEARLPLARYPQLVAVVVASGVWLRTVLALAVVVEGADFPVMAFARQLILPGILLDLLVFTVLYIPIRIIGRGAQTLTLERERYAL